VIKCFIADFHTRIHVSHQLPTGNGVQSVMSYLGQCYTDLYQSTKNARKKL